MFQLILETGPDTCSSIAHVGLSHDFQNVSMKVIFTHQRQCSHLEDERKLCVDFFVPLVYFYEGPTWSTFCEEEIRRADVS